MPEIPTFVSTQGYGSGVAQGGAISPEVAGRGWGQLADGMERVSAQFAQIAEKQAQQQAYLEAAQIESNVSMQIADMQEKYATDPDPATAGKRFQQEMQALQSKTVGTISNPMVQAHVLRSMAQRAPVAYAHVLKQATQNLNQNVATTAMGNASDAAKQFAAAPDEATQLLALQTMRERIDGAVAVGAMNPERGRMEKSKTLAEGIMLIANTDPQRAQSLATRFRDALDSSHLVHIETSVKAASNRITGQDIAADIFRGNRAAYQPTPEDVGALKATAERLGVSATDLAAAMHYESRWNPGIRGGKNDQHIGLIQFGAEEQRQFGASQNQSFQEQLGAVERYLKTRGLPPDADLATIYRTINGGNPNAALTASDGNGTIEQHIGRIRTGGSLAAAEALVGTVPAAAAQSASPQVQASRGEQVREVLRRTEGNPQAREAALTGLHHLWSADEADRVQVERARVEAARAAHEASEADQTRIVADVMGVGQNAGITAQQIANPAGPYPNLTPEARLRMIGFMDRQSKPDPMAIVSNATATNLLADMRRPEGDPRRIADTKPIYDAYIAGTLTRTDFDFLQKQFKEMGSDDGQRLSAEVTKLVAGAKGLIDKSNPLAGKMDPTGPYRLMLYERMVQDKITEYRKAGKNPYDLLNPANPDWLGGRHIISRYENDMTQTIREIQRGMTPQSQRTGLPEMPAPVAPAQRRPLSDIFKPAP